MHVDLKSKVLRDNLNPGDLLVSWFVRFAPGIGSRHLRVVVSKHEQALEQILLDFYC